ncbi:AAEL002899-PA, partial [Aedes aegypti]
LSKFQVQSSFKTRACDETIDIDCSNNTRRVPNICCKSSKNTMRNNPDEC